MVDDVAEIRITATSRRTTKGDGEDRNSLPPQDIRELKIAILYGRVGSSAGRK